MKDGGVEKGKRQRTEVSDPTTKPKFKKNKHTLKLGEELVGSTTAIVSMGGFVVLPAKDGKSKGPGQAAGHGRLSALRDRCAPLTRRDGHDEPYSHAKDLVRGKTIPVGKLSVALSLTGVGDNVVLASKKGPDRMAVNIIAHGAGNLSTKFFNTTPGNDKPSTMVEARIIDAKCNELIENVMKKRAKGQIPSAEIQELAGTAQEASETRVRAQTENPRGHELLSIGL